MMGRRNEGEFPEHLKIAGSDLHLGRVIGLGISSEVSRARWLRCEVIVKQFHLHQDVRFRTFTSHAPELEILMSLPHPHVVQLLGYHADSRVVSIMMESMETTLSEVIASRMRVSSPPFALHEAVDIMTKIALGMRFLHSRGITHGCLSAGIVLMNVHPRGEFDVKIGGFSLSHYADSGCAPFDRQVRIVADVYRFASICNEILTGRQPWNKPGPFPKDIDPHLQHLVCRCWDSKPEGGPDFEEIYNTLAARSDSVLNQRTVAESLWTSYSGDEDDTCVDIAAVLQTLPGHLSVNPAHVEWRQFIGKGGYNEVYEVNWLGCSFALKMFHALSQSFRKELDFLMKLQHPHIARLIGLSLDDNGSGWIMMERMDMDLRQLIDLRMQQKKSRFSWTVPAPFSDAEVWELCHKIALGINFLHSQQVVHRDIKAANVLVRRSDVKIADFGVSHRIENPNVVGCAGTGLWRAPEVLRGEKLAGEKLKKTDVYSYGMLCYEIVTGHFPYEGEVMNSLTHPVQKEDVLQGCRPKLPSGLNPHLGKLISDCWQEDPSKRPDFAIICDVFANNPVCDHVVLPQSTLSQFIRRIVHFVMCWFGGLKSDLIWVVFCSLQGAGIAAFF